MMYVVTGLWILIWFAAGYFTARIIQTHNINKIVAAQRIRHLEYIRETELDKNLTNAVRDNQVVYNPFEGILKN